MNHNLSYLSAFIMIQCPVFQIPLEQKTIQYTYIYESMESGKVKDKNSVALPTVSIANISELKDSILHPSYTPSFGLCRFFGS